MIEDIDLKYSVGALLYSPALNNKLAKSVIDGKFGDMYSLAICLEDTIADDQVEMAENQMYETLDEINKSDTKAYIPKIFIRIREYDQMTRIWSKAKSRNLITGFIIPKYTISNAEKYNEELILLNKNSQRKIYMMPILESKDIIDLKTRYGILHTIKDYLDTVSKYILNVRVGGNDFSNQFAVRRHMDETIYDIRPIANLLSDILTVFGRDYIVSGPVWEYFASENNEWKMGLQKELKFDILNGFIGKTVIHPNQIPIVNESLKVMKSDYEDANSIINWEEDNLQVGKSNNGERMNEVKTHINWAKKIIALSKIYGISRDEYEL